MKLTINISEQLGENIRTRKTMQDFDEKLNLNDEYLLDFSSVAQISRSAADELYNIIHSGKKVVTVNMSSFVQKMLDAVTISRFNPRIRHESQTIIIHCDTMESVTQLLLGKAL